MELVEPTDFEILAYLAEKGRNNAVNVAVALDRDRGYMNTRLGTLADYGCVRRVGPAENSGLYEITGRGEAALEHRDARHDPDTNFESLIEASVAGESAGTDPGDAETDADGAAE
ncbi:ArsR family transcriptional regulator [Halobellus sp. Atlit-38R]|nr:ArsR family transcriptional regulator [Halobellus sp. Atlit-38R]RLM91059.1 ArsR family transcriptional regulator [Halobellus sp. Atlit-38R]